ncbi:fructose-6-phosphate aldolase [Bradymonadaceae bacterium TMQ3]|uniref:Probable transaldolase n=1 Tax=Lujinxingia sediminis TaxID=2480984 RepID=A0ABY0CXN2_9DELT|nr:fructose-6-phosphate aldolase [Lujinxingia sediminis]RDV39310.1 fructose-6-phosphate aldolase [Bradymonadaceae bacterium TMQ3]RVU48652.1 fructose-6-phosphate aldolase [Lujinxingia sediminis]TXC77945.1 fructose-6-phosphate aldolase [Bradymonadales bacterium TMQ1]
MKFFIDTADTTEIRTAAQLGILDGVTTNPSLIAKSGRPFKEVILEICELVDGPVSAEVTATDTEGMVREGREFASWADNIVVKIPLTPDGLKACKTLTDEGIGVNVTLCFSTNQALLAARAGATYISPFIGRLDDLGQSGMDLIEEIVAAYANYPNIHTQVLVASIRHPRHVAESALLGAHVATIPFNIIDKMFQHPLTDTGLEKFLKDWEKVPKA